MPARGPDARGPRGERAPKIAERLAGDSDELDRLKLARALGISRKRLLGWEPTERHEHFDDTGRLTGWTVVTREPEWDDAERDALLGLVLYEATLCSGCGLPPSVTSDPKNHVFQLENHYCPACRNWAQFGRIQAHQDKQALDARGDKTPPAAPLPSDGRHTRMRKLTPLEVATRRDTTGSTNGSAASVSALVSRSARRPHPA